MVMVSTEVDAAAMVRLENLLRRIEVQSPKRLAAETRRAAIYICQSLRARTKRAPKKMRSSEYSLQPIKGLYAHSKTSKRLIHLWEYKHLPGTPHEKRKMFGAFATRHRSKETKWKWRGLDKAKERKEIIDYRKLTTIRRAGLAKLSWGWVMKQIHNNGEGDLSWKMLRGERRDPRQFVKGMFFQSVVTKNATAEIHNHLDYILDALPPGAIGEALDAATRRLEHNVVNHIQRTAS